MPAERTEFADAVASALQAARRRGATQKDLGIQIATQQIYRSRQRHGPEREAARNLASGRWEKRLSAWKLGSRIPENQAELVDALSVIDPDGSTQRWIRLWQKARAGEKVPVDGRGLHSTPNAQTHGAKTTAESDEGSALTGNTQFEDLVDHLVMTEQTHTQSQHAESSISSIAPVPTGFAKLDLLTGGLQPGQLIVIAGSPSMGKSILALDIARSAAVHHDLPTVLFSMEMNRNDITLRLLSAEARVPLVNLRASAMREEDWTRLAKTMGDVSEAPMFLDDSPNLTMVEMNGKCQQLKRSGNLKLVIIDYLQLLRLGRDVGGYQLEIREITRELKLLATELEVPIVALSQLEAPSAQAYDKTPRLSDLGDYKPLEQHADLIILLYRDDFYEYESPRAGEADFIVAKHRNGTKQTVTVAFQGHYARFVDMA